MYILDEPSIGLHSRDTERLVKVLKSLQAQAIHLLLVEHDEEIMRAADELIDLGPEAGVNGGKLVFQGDQEAIKTNTESITARYLNKLEKISAPEKRRPWKYFIEINGARENNLKNVDVKIPLGVLTVVTGVAVQVSPHLLRKCYIQH